MEDTWLHIANYFFFGFHTILVLFNLTGWIFPKTRRLHFYSIALTLFSWGVLGIFYGFGYCFLTDWHYSVLRQLGESGMPSSYIVFFIERLTGWQPDPGLTNTVVVVVTLLLLVITVYVNFFRAKGKNS